MAGTRRSGSVAVAALVALLSTASPHAQSDVLRFDWALGALTGPDRTFVSIGRQAALHSGDQLKIFLRLKQRGFIYVVLHDTADQLTLLHPALIQPGEPAVDVPLYIPPATAWMRLDNRVGQETIYLIASSVRLDAIEELLKQYAASPPPDRHGVAARVLDQIARLKEQFRPGDSPAERPAEIAGRVRGLQTDVAAFATEVSARRFYSRTITIDHQ